MTRILPTILLLAACTTQPTLPAPGDWRPASLRPGVIASADLVAQCVYYDRRLFDLPREIQAAVILHELCHLRGEVTESGADCCAARLYADLYGVAQATAVAYYWMGRRDEAVEWWLRCAR